MDKSMTMAEVKVGCTYSILRFDGKIRNRTIVQVVCSKAGRYKIVTKDWFTYSDGSTSKTWDYESRFYAGKHTMWTIN